MFVKTFEQLGKDMFEECGGKAAHLGELTSLKLNVPRGYTVLGDSYYHHLMVNGLVDKIHDLASSIDFGSYQATEEKTAMIRALIIAAPMPPEIEREIVENYGKLTNGEEPFVAVRSSVAMRNSAISSFPGMMDTYHYIRGAANVAEKVKECWASVWSARAAHTRNTKKLDHDKAIIAPTVQLMVNSEVAGVLFTLNPVTKARDQIMIESNWGLGETVVSGKCQSDLYVVAKEKAEIIDEKIADKRETYAQASNGGAAWADVPPEKHRTPTLGAEQIREMCRVARIIEDHYGCCQDIEWAIEKGRLYILQARKARAGGE